ncbi:hypothetical protein ACJRO7_030381 [Eucalyptus globulus]|uniref:Pectinesterase inhibitor domain-containing protein n=1 Tax=Eucalyptus globulus TaxID=34317 RepID=A0ABD3JBG1_EUCGL
MNRAFSISSLFLILFLIFHRVQSAKDIVWNTRKKLADSDPNYNFAIFVKSLGSNPKSHGADLERLGLIWLKLLQANLTDTTKYIKQLLEQNLEQRQLKALSLCLDAYLSSEGMDVTPTYREKRYFDVNIWVYRVLTNENICDTQGSEKKGIIPPLTKCNANIFQLSFIVSSIMAVLRGRE